MSESTLVRKKIVDAMTRRVIEDAVGTSEPPYRRYTGDPPDATFWLGNLTPESRVLSSPDRRQSIERFTPAAQGFSFKVARLPVTLDVAVSFAVWIALHPTLTEQRNRAGLSGVEDDEDGNGVGVQGALGHPHDRSVPLARVRMKVPVRDVHFCISIPERGRRTSGMAEIDNGVSEALRQLPGDAIPHRPLKPRKGRPKESDLRDEASWAAWEHESLDDPALPVWKAAVDVEVTGPDEGPFEVTVTIVNRTDDCTRQFVDRDRTRAFPTWACDPALYEVRLSATLSEPIVPYELEQIPDSYRYDRKVYALGENAAVEVDGQTLANTFAAVAETDRVFPRTRTAPGELLDTRFATLKSDPIPALDRLLQDLREWTASHWGNAALDAMAASDNWLPATRQRADEDARSAHEEIEWVSTGIRLLREDPDLLEAFKLMNEVMERVAAGRYEAWYPFQIAFILGCLQGVRNPAMALRVDILWFSTGGGKTEGYLGLNVLYLFYQRLTGRTSGAQSWFRFPLRLLSLQQTQRIADAVVLAELVRARHPRMRDGDPLSVGYYVGAGNTPNKVVLPGSPYYMGWDPFDERNTAACRVLEYCPVCRGPQPPVVRFDTDSHTMVHECANPGCRYFRRRLPVYVVDDDIYRWAPSVIVGTIDKLAQVGQQSDFRVLFGRALSRCPKHGYSASLDRCGVQACRETLRPIPPGFGGLGFEIQDELHLLSESLGALDGNYETLFQALAAETGTSDIRIVAATATIEGYEQQADQLYRRDARRFPVPGPTKRESFWAFEQPGDPLRSYVAMLPRGTTMLNAAFLITRSHWRFLRAGMDNPAAFCSEVLSLSPTKASEVAGYLREDYEVLVTYALRKQDLERYARDLADDAEICPSPANYASITGDVEFWDVRDILNRLQDPPSQGDERIRVLGATSAISHGVDVNRLNAMIVMGMPHQTAEYIQATARVGRRYPAVVFSLINPMRERDVSHFRYFKKYAEYLDRLVEPVPVNRESIPVLKRVLPGGLMALLLQVFEPAWLYPGGQVPRSRRERLWFTRGVIKAIDDGFITEGDLATRLTRAFAVHPSDPRFALHRQTIQNFVGRNINALRLRRGSASAVKDELDPPPPRSLRDVETNIEIIGER